MFSSALLYRRINMLKTTTHSYLLENKFHNILFQFSIYFSSAPAKKTIEVPPFITLKDFARLVRQTPREVFKNNLKGSKKKKRCFFLFWRL